MQTITFLILLGLFSNFEEFSGLKLNDVKLIDSFEGTTSYTLILLDAGTMDKKLISIDSSFAPFSQVYKETNTFLEIIEISKSYINKNFLNTIFLAINGSIDNTNSINPETRTKRRAIKMRAQNERENNNNFLHNNLLASNNSFLGYSFDYTSEIPVIFDSSFLKKAMLSSGISSKIVNINNAELDAYLDVLSQMIYYFELNTLPYYFDTFFKKYIESGLNKYKELYRESSISGKTFYAVQEKLRFEKSILDKVSSTATFSKIEVTNEKNKKLKEYRDHIFDQIMSYQNNNVEAQNIEIILNSEFLKNDDLSILGLFRDDGISFILIKPNSL